MGSAGPTGAQLKPTALTNGMSLRLAQATASQAEADPWLTPAPGYVADRSGKPRPALDPVQIQKAQAWYRANSSIFTPAVIKEVQQKLNTPATGKPDIAFVKAVAKWQASYNLFISSDREVSLKNGKTSMVYPSTGVLNPEQLSKMFPTGLARPETAAAYAKNAQALSDQWASLATKDKRLKAVYSLLNRLLAAAGVYEPEFLLVNMPTEERGAFSPQKWELALNSSLFSQRQVSPEEVDEMLTTLYHEVRHADQLMQVLRYLAGRGMTVTQIKQITSMRGKQVQAAMKKPIPPGSAQGIVAREWFESYFGSQRTYRAMVLRDLNMNFDAAIAANTAELNRLQAQLHLINGQLKTATGQKQSDLNREKIMVQAGINRFSRLLAEQRAKRDGAYPAYLALPEERDAWDVQKQVARNFNFRPETP